MSPCAGTRLMAAFANRDPRTRLSPILRGAKCTPNKGAGGGTAVKVQYQIEANLCRIRRLRLN